MSAGEPLLVSRPAEGVLLLELNRPGSLNALNTDLLGRLLAVLEALPADESTRCLVLTGVGRAFAAGADIAEMGALDARGFTEMMDLGRAVMEALDHAPIPSIAAVNGYALGGGCELALACTVILAAESGVFGLPEVDLAIMPGWGGTVRLPGRVGIGRAREMILTGRKVRAPEALAMGLCDRLVATDSLREQALALAVTLAAKDPGSLRACRLSLRRQAELDPGEALAVERRLFAELFDRPERRAAFERFLARSGKS